MLTRGTHHVVMPLMLILVASVLVHSVQGSGQGNSSKISHPYTSLSQTQTITLLSNAWTKIGKLHSIPGVRTGLRLWSGQIIYIEGKRRSYKEYLQPAPDEGWISDGPKPTQNTVDIIYTGLVQNGAHREYEVYVEYAFEQERIRGKYFDTFNERVYPRAIIYETPGNAFRLGDSFTCDKCNNVAPQGTIKEIVYYDNFEEATLIGVHEWWQWKVGLTVAATVSFVTGLGALVASVALSAEKKVDPDARGVITIEKGYGTLIAFDYDSKQIEYHFWGVGYQLREHARWRPTYSPNIRFLKQSSSILRIDSYQSGWSSMGYGWAFVVVPRDWLNGKYIRFRWSGYFSYSGARYVAAAYIYDGEYNRASDADFPEGSEIPTKGAGRLQILAEKNVGGSWGPETVDVLANVAAGTQSKVTIFFRMGDAWAYQTVYLDIDWFEINTGIGGSGRLTVENFDANVVMQRTGTYGDYGYGYISP